MSSCVSCHSSKAGLECNGCNEAVCKTCAQFIDEDTFAYMSALPSELKLGAYCAQCHDVKVAPRVEEYQAILDRAGDVFVYLIDQGKESRLLKRARERVKVVDCEDRVETLNRLTFQAAQMGFSVIVEVDITSRKVRKDSYQTTLWSGEGVLAYPREPRR